MTITDNDIIKEVFAEPMITFAIEDWEFFNSSGAELFEDVCSNSTIYVKPLKTERAELLECKRDNNKLFNRKIAIPFSLCWNYVILKNTWFICLAVQKILDETLDNNNS